LAFNEYLFLNLLKSRESVNHSILLGNIYRSPSSTQDNDYELCKMFDFIQEKFTIPKLIVGDFNFPNISWYPAYGCGEIARCTDLTLMELKY